MAYKFDDNTCETTTTEGANGMQIAGLGVPVKVSSVTSVTDKEMEKAAKAQQRAEAKAAKKAAEKAEREKIRAATFQRIAPMLNAGDALATKHDGYVAQYVTNANADLYALLTDIHAFAETVLNSADCDAVIKQMRETLRWEHEIKTQANSPALNIIVRFITRTNRKNACVYARVIRKAMADGITSADLTQYIIKEKGIDNIREKVAKKEVDPVDVKTAETFWKYAESYLEAQVKKPMATFKLGYEHSAYMADTVRAGRFTYFVCEHVGNEYKVVDALLMDKELEQKILERVYCNLMEQTIFTQEDVDLRNAIESKLGLKRVKPLVANAYTGN